MKEREVDLFGDTIWNNNDFPRPWVADMKAIIERRVASQEREAKARPYYTVREGNSTWIIHE